MIVTVWLPLCLSPLFSSNLVIEFKLSMLKKLEIVSQLLSILFINLIVDIDQRRTSVDINFANKIGLKVHVGHGITFASAKRLSKINGIKEFNIGHFLIGESIFIGIRDCIKKFKSILKKWIFTVSVQTL